MTEKELDNWFCSLEVKNKQHIASKILLKNGEDVHFAVYPNCTNVWIALTPESKQKIHDHCTDRHGMFIKPGGDATIFSY